MTSKILVLGDAALVTGFSLAGIENTVQVKDSEFPATFESYLTKSEFGIIVAPEAYLAKLDWRTKKRLENLAYPVIVPMPDYSGKSVEGDQIKSMIKRALGFDLK